MRAALDGAVAASREFAAGARQDALRMHASLVPGDEGPPRLHLELAVPEDLRGHFDVAAIRASAPVDGPLADAAAEAVQNLAWRFDLARGQPDAAIGLLGAHDPETVLLALEWIRDRPAPAADPALADAAAQQLERDEPEVVLLAPRRAGPRRRGRAMLRR